ncbi:MAG: DNA-binding protein WhiA [Clostridia bacterium]|nr:DNA-binding protein WhiA [Clostridia bacterium]
MGIYDTIKRELLDSKFHAGCCKRAFLSGVIRGAGSLYIKKDGFGLVIQHSSLELLDKCSYVVKSLTGTVPDCYQKEKDRRLGTKVVYELLFPEEFASKLLKDTWICPSPYEIIDGIAPEIIANECCKRSFLKGLFLASGALSLPSWNSDDHSNSNNGYHLEMSVTSESVAEDLLPLLLTFGIDAKMRMRKNIFSVYLKNAEKISDFFALIGAIQGLFELQELIAERWTSNNINRTQNCEMANFDKMAQASSKQIVAISRIIDLKGIDYLDSPLRETAHARLENPDAPLSRLSELLPDHPSKSGLNHRLKKIIQIAEQLEGENDNGN